MALTLSIAPSVLSLIALVPGVILVIAVFVLQARPSALASTARGTGAWLAGRVVGRRLDPISDGETEQTGGGLVVLRADH